MEATRIAYLMFIPFFVPFDDSPDLSPASLLCGVASDGFFFFCLPCGSCASDLLGFGFSGDFPETSLLIRMSMRGFDSAGLKILWKRVKFRHQFHDQEVNGNTNARTRPLSLLIALILSSLFCLLASISSAVVSAAVLSSHSRQPKPELGGSVGLAAELRDASETV